MQKSCEYYHLSDCNCSGCVSRHTLPQRLSATSQISRVRTCHSHARRVSDSFMWHILSGRTRVISDMCWRCGSVYVAQVAGVVAHTHWMHHSVVVIHEEQLVARQVVAYSIDVGTSSSPTPTRARFGMRLTSCKSVWLVSAKHWRTKPEGGRSLHERSTSITRERIRCSRTAPSRTDRLTNIFQMLGRVKSQERKHCLSRTTSVSKR